MFPMPRCTDSQLPGYPIVGVANVPDASIYCNLAADSAGQDTKLPRGLNVEDPGLPWADC
jgi:hypothetical protein